MPPGGIKIIWPFSFWKTPKLNWLLTWPSQLELSHASRCLHSVPQWLVLIQKNLGELNFTVIDLQLLLHLKDIPKRNSIPISSHFPFLCTL